MMQFTEEQRKALAAEIVEQLVDCGSADDVAVERYTAWVFNRLSTIAPQAVPDGWKLVPVEPTAAMYDAGDRQLATKQVWDAMLAAAPEVE